MPASIPLRRISRIAGLALVPLLLAACGDRAQPEPADNAVADRGVARASNEDPRPTITPDMLDAYIRGMEEEIALMHATDGHMKIAAIAD